MAKKFLINRFYKAWQKRKCFNKKKTRKENKEKETSIQKNKNDDCHNY